MPKYGLIHRVVDFSCRIVPKVGTGAYKDLFIHHVFNLLKALDEVERTNPWITLMVHAGDGIWIIYKGRRLLLLLPAQKHVRVVMSRQADGRAELVKLFKKNPGCIEKVNHRVNYLQWNINSSGFERIIGFVSGLDAPKDNTNVLTSYHTRYFPGEVREAALSRFELDGKWCPGVSGISNKHKVLFDQGETIEFDHILPFSRGGSSTLENIQILCQTCNSRKQATAL